MVRPTRLISLLRRLIAIDSQNPPGNETRIALFCKKHLEGLGLRVKMVSFKKNRPNLLVTLKGSSSEKSLLITPHLDTVPAGKRWGVDPFAGVIKKGKLYGLGATDCKSNLACSIEVMQSLIEEKEKLPYDLIFAATADEETGSALGLIPLLDRKILTPDAALVLDADDYKIVVAQKGLLHLTVSLRGKRAHGAYPWLGKNAVAAAVSILAELARIRIGSRSHTYLRQSTMNIGTIRGGDKVNVVADWCEFELDFRFLPGESEAHIIGMLKKIIQKYSRQYTVRIDGVQKPYEIATTHPLVKGLVSAMRAHGVRPVISGSEGATVITFFQHKNIPAVATGFGVEGCAHTTDEYVRISNVITGARLLEDFLKNYRFS